MSGRPASDAAATRGVRAWDGATRLFHWALVALIVSAFVTRKMLNDPTLYWHRVNGYTVLTLLIFRVIWGVVGSSTARFAGFIPGPMAILRYARSLLRGAPLHYLGHNPLGSLLIFAMLLAVAAQAGTGLFTNDDVIAQGPLYDHAPDWATRIAGAYHAKGFWIILALASLHIVANLAYQFGLKDRLITAMITGSKPRIAYVDQEEARIAPPLRALASFVAAAVLVAGGVMLAGDSLLR